MHQERVGDIREPAPCLIVVDGDWLFAQVCGSHHKGIHAGIGEEKMLEWRIGQVDAEPGNAWSDGGRDAVLGPSLSEDNGARRCLEECLFLGRERTEVTRSIEVANHDCEWLAVAVLALSQTFDGRFVGGVHGEVEPADAFDCEHFTAEKPLNRLGNWIFVFDPYTLGCFEPDLRAARPAGVWLGVKSPVQGIFVFGPTLGAHGKDSHRGLRPVVRNAARDGETRPAVCAVEKWIAIAAVRGVEQLAKAVGASCGVGWDSGGDLSQNFTDGNSKTCFPIARQLMRFNGIDAGKEGCLGGEAMEKRIEPKLGTFQLDEHPIGVVPDEAGQMFFCSEPVYEWAKTDTLNDSSNPNALADQFCVLTGI